MARKPRKAKQTELETAITRSNGYDQTTVKRFVSEIERCDEQIRSIKAENAARCKGVMENKKDIYDAARNAGLPKSALRAVIAVREMERRVKEARAKLEDDGQDSFDMIRHALGDFGDLPLGAAALNKAAERRSAAVDSIADDDDGDGEDPRPAFLKRSEADRAADANAEKLNEGIRQL